ncbi:hypothetical protein BX666DRAFT_1979976 [Dichotomocladium elegans]|nr:hypothetical protein BX666DRAFT_1979976 [Dichotomocladium elegans]
MASLLAFICPSGMHALMSLTLAILISLAIPAPPHHSSSSFFRVRDLLLSQLEHCYTRLILRFLLPLLASTLMSCRNVCTLSFPDTEETAFEEQFKYLIVTSSLLHEYPTLSTTTSNSIMTIAHPSPPFLFQHRFRVFVFPGLIVSMAVLSLILWWTKIFPFLFTCVAIGFTALVHSMLCVFLWQYQRRVKIRQIYATALDLLNSLIRTSEKNDLAMTRLLDQIAHLDAIHQGATLAPATAVANSTSSSSPRCVQEIRRVMTDVMASQWSQWSFALHTLQLYSHQANIQRFCDMYGILTTQPWDQQLSLEEQLHIIHLKRRECLVHLLALDVMTLEHDSERRDYESHWQVVLKIIKDLIDNYEKHISTLKEHLFISSDLFEGTNRTGSPRVHRLLHPYAAFEKQVKALQSKLLLCRQETALDRIGDRLHGMEQDMAQMMVQWEDIRDAYRKLTMSLPSPPSSPKYPLAKKQLSRRSMVSSSALACFPESNRSATSL